MENQEVVVKKPRVRKIAVEGIIKPPAVRKPRAKKVVAAVAAPVDEAPAVAEVLAPPAPVKRDFTEAKKKWQLGDIDEMVYMPRDEFVQSVLGQIGGARPVEEVIVRGATPGQLAKDLRDLAGQYIVLRDKGGRLPKFSKWLTSMFQDNKDLHIVLAREAQAAGNGDRPVKISGDIVDLVRLADTRHYASCLAANGMYKEVMRLIVEKCPGIFIAYIDGDDDKMRGRIFLNHGRIGDEHVVFAAGQFFGNGFTHTMLADYFADLGVRYFHYQGWAYGGGEYKKGKQVVITPVNCVGQDNRHIHYDTPTWNDVTCYEVLPTNPLKKAA